VASGTGDTARTFNNTARLTARISRAMIGAAQPSLSACILAGSGLFPNRHGRFRHVRTS